MSFLKRILGIDTPDGQDPPVAPSQAATVRRITEALDDLPPEQAKYVACFAYLLGRVAHADLDISEDESREMERVVMELGGLPEEQALIVVQVAKTQNLLFGHTDGYTVSREFAGLSSREQKLRLLDCLFAVSAADQEVTTAEDNVIRNIAQELKLDHSEFINARSRYRDYLAVLKKRPPGAE